MSDQITGPLRALIPLLTAVFVSWGFDNVTAGLAAAAVIAVGAAVWSWFSNRTAAHVAAVAAAKGTEVSKLGTTITLVDPHLAETAKLAATDVRGNG